MAAGCNVVNEGSNNGAVQDEFIQLCGFAGNLAAGKEAVRVDKEQAVKQIAVAAAGHQSKGGRASAGNNVVRLPITDLIKSLISCTYR